MENIIIIIRSIAILLLIWSTYKATVSLPRLEKSIHNDEDIINNIDRATILSTISLLNINDIRIRSDINILESNLNAPPIKDKERISEKNKERISELRETA